MRPGHFRPQQEQGPAWGKDLSNPNPTCPLDWPLLQNSVGKRSPGGRERGNNGLVLQHS